MSELRVLFETFKLSFYETTAVLLPGVVLLIVLKWHFPSLSISTIDQIPIWVVFLVLAFVIGHVLKGLWTEVANQYRFRFEPWYRGLLAEHVKPETHEVTSGLEANRDLAKAVGTAKNSFWHRKYFSSRKPLPWYLAPAGLRIFLLPLYSLVLWSYVDWRGKRVANRVYEQSAEFSKIKERVQRMFGLDSKEIKLYEYWSMCYGSLPDEEQKERDRFDSIADMMRSLIVVIFVSAGITVVQGGFNTATLGVLILYWIFFRSLYNRALRYEALSSRNVYRRFFQRFCREDETKEIPKN